MEIVVTGIGCISALGKRLETSWQRLLRGESAIQLRRPFGDLAAYPLALIEQTPISLAALTHRAVAEALEDAGLCPPLLDCGVVIGSSRSHQAQWEQLVYSQWRQAHASDLAQYGTKQAILIDENADQGLPVLIAGDPQRLRTLNPRQAKTKPAAPDRLVAKSEGLEHWLDTLPHMSAIATARQIGATGPVLAPMAACATGLWAIAQGYELIQSGQCQRVLVGAVESPITPLTLIGFQQMGALAQTGAYPFDRDREGLVLGEGGAVLVLESAELAKQRSAPIYGKILGFGLTADGYHVSAPDPARRGAIAAIQQCLAQSCLLPEAIHYIHAHGTATQLNDRNEAHLIQTLFPPSVPVSSTKGATGHTLGASGALGVAFCLMALRQQTLPPCIGLRTPEFDLNWVTLAQPASIQQTLCCSFGFGGQNAVVALGRPD